MDGAKTKMINNAKEIALPELCQPTAEQTCWRARLDGALHMPRSSRSMQNFAAEAKIWEQEKAQVFQIATY